MRYLSPTMRLAKVVASLALTIVAASLLGGTVTALAANAGIAAGDLSHRELRHRAVCPLPRTTPCSIRKPVLSGYRLLGDQVDLDDHGEFWLADLSKTGKKPGDLPPLRILADNGVMHLIEISFGAVEGKLSGSGKPVTPRKAADKTKTTTADAAKTLTKSAPSVDSGGKAVEACIEKCRQEK